MRKQQQIYRKTGIKVSLSQIKLQPKKKSDRLQEPNAIEDDKSLKDLHDEVNHSID